DQMQALRLERERHRLALQAERLPEDAPAKVDLPGVVPRAPAHEPQRLLAQMSSSSPSTSRARSMMNLKRAETSLPSRSLITRSVSSSLTMLTRRDGAGGGTGGTGAAEGRAWWP